MASENIAIEELRMRVDELERLREVDRLKIAELERWREREPVQMPPHGPSTQDESSTDSDPSVEGMRFSIENFWRFELFESNFICTLISNRSPNRSTKHKTEKKTVGWFIDCCTYSRCQ